MSIRTAFVNIAGGQALLGVAMVSMVTAHSPSGSLLYYANGGSAGVSTDDPATVAVALGGMIALQAVANPGVDFFVNPQAITYVGLSGADNASLHVAGVTAAIVTTQDMAAIQALANA